MVRKYQGKFRLVRLISLHSGRALSPSFLYLIFSRYVLAGQCVPATSANPKSWFQFLVVRDFYVGGDPFSLRAAMVFKVILLIGITLVSISQAIPQVTFPINSQVPPLARVSQPYEFQFSQNTFTTTTPDVLTYSLQNAPTWLSIDSAKRTLSGKPSPSDIGDAVFELIATDGSGSATLPTTIVVSNTPAPSFNANISDILAKAGPLLDTSSLNLYPRADFTVIFPGDAFIGSGNLTYCATSADRSPLPSWIEYDPTTNTFSGTTTPPVPNPQVVSIRLIASDVEGFEGASTIFDLVTSDHSFVFSTVYQEVSVDANSLIRVSTALDMDGQQASLQSILSLNANASGWLQFNSNDISLSGKVPPDFQSQTVRIIASDNFNDNAYTYVNLSKRDIPEPTLPSTSSSSSAALFAGSSINPATMLSTNQSNPRAMAGHIGRQKWIIAAIVVPVFAGLLIIALLFWCLKRRKLRRRPGNYVEHFAVDKPSEKSQGFWRGHQAVVPRPKAAGKRPRGPNTQKADSFRFSGGSAMGSPEARVWDTNEQALSAYGLSIPQLPSRVYDELHPLRSNGISPSLRPVKRRDRFSSRSGHWNPVEMRGALGPFRWSKASSGRISGVDQAIVIPKCDNCESDQLKCLDCGSRQVTSALAQVRAQRRSKIETMDLRNEGQTVEKSFDEVDSMIKDERERERREAEEYVNRPLGERFQDYQSRKKRAGTFERFSNSGNGSRASSYATTGHRLASSMRAPSGDLIMEESALEAEGSRVEYSQDSISSLEEVLHNQNTARDFLRQASDGVELPKAQAAEIGRRRRMGAIRTVNERDEAEDSDVDATSGLREEEGDEMASSDAEAFI